MTRMLVQYSSRIVVAAVVAAAAVKLFTALHGMQTRSSDENSVCLSVRLSSA